jgi:acetyl-CoA C-acetyltransferase
MDPAVAYKTYFAPQGIGADLIATKYGFSRHDVDAYAMESQKRAAQAWAEGRFKNSVVGVRDVIGEIVLAHDEHMRPQTDMQSLASPGAGVSGDGRADAGLRCHCADALPEVEKIDHVHHGGNSSGIVDGAAAVLIGNKEMGEKYGLKPRARIRAMASIGSEPMIMLTGPEFVANKVLKRAGMTKDRHRPVRTERGLCQRGAALHAGAQHPA